MTTWQWKVIIAIIRILLKNPSCLLADKKDVDLLLEALERENKK